MAATEIGHALAQLSADDLDALARGGEPRGSERAPWPLRNVAVLILWRQRWPTALQFAAWRRLELGRSCDEARQASSDLVEASAET